MGQSLAPEPGASSNRAAAPSRGAASAEVIVPDISTAKRSEPLPAVQPRAPFVLAWHPERWMVHAGQVVPDLRLIRLSPGISGVKQTPARRGQKPRIIFTFAKARLELRGFTLLPHSLGPDGSYVRRVWVDPSARGAARKAHFCTPWENYYPGSAKVVSDEAGYAKWLDSLVKDGHIPPCPPHILTKLSERARDRLGRLEAEVSKGVTAAIPAAKAVKAELIILEERIEAATKDIEPVVPDDAPIIPGGVEGL